MYNTLYFSIVIGIGIIVYIAVKRKKAIDKYNKLDKAGFVLNIVLGLLYIPISFESLNSITGSDVFVVPYESGHRVVGKPQIHVYISMFMPLICAASITTSAILRKRGYSRLSFFIQFIPVVTFMVLVGIYLLSISKT